jgi:hypothetical protein
MMTWVVPVEAIRASGTVAGARLMARLVEEGAVFQPSATVQLQPSGYVATVQYSSSKGAARWFAVTVPLAWAPVENKAAA